MSGISDDTDFTTQDTSVGSLVGASTGINSGWVFDQPKSSDTATTNAIQSMQPVDSSNAASSSGLSSFWQGIIGSVVHTGEQIAVKQSGTVQPVVTTPVVVQPNPNRTLLLFGLIGVVVLIVTHKG